MVWDARFRGVLDPVCFFLRMRAADALPAPTRDSTRNRRNSASGPATGRHGAAEIRVYHGAIMQHDTILLPRQAPAAGWPEPTVTEQLAGTVAQVTPDERLPAVPHGAAETTLPDPAEAPDRDRLGNQIAELSARIQVATYELLCYLREFDRHHGWEGFRSCAHWLNWRTGLDLGAAREKLRVAAALADLNHISAAMACGRLSYSTVRALTRVATPATEARLVAVACCATAAQVERLVRAWRQADRAAQPDAEQARLARRALSTRVDDDGMVVLRARLTPEVGAVVLRALEAALEQVPAAAQEDAGAHHRAAACGCAGSGGRKRVGRRARYGQPRRSLPGGRARGSGDPGCLARAGPCSAWRNFRGNARLGSTTMQPPDHPAALGAISAETRELSPAASAPAAPTADLDAGQAVIEQAGGIHVGTEVARRVACDAGLVVLRHAADGNVLDVGRRTRTIPTALRRALEGRDRNQCQFPGCSSRHCDAHRVVHWADGGATRLANLVLCCAISSAAARIITTASGEDAPLRRPSRRALGRWRRHAPHQLGPLLSISSPHGT